MIEYIHQSKLLRKYIYKKMKKIILTDQFRLGAPAYRGVALSCNVHNTESDTSLWETIDRETQAFCRDYTVEQINKRLPIRATREAYKSFGKDPNRYRPSAEALCRRILKDKSLYRINTLVDLINLVSIRSGYSIGGFDEDKIAGDLLTLDVGKKEDVFTGIGRGLLNIEGLPVFRDGKGGIGTPTSDEERTRLDVETTQLLMIINGYEGGADFEETVDFTQSLLKRYASVESIDMQYFEY